MKNFLIIIILLSCSATQSKKLNSPQFVKSSGKFKNNYVKEKPLSDVFKWLWTRDKQEWPEKNKNKKEDSVQVVLNENEFALSFINHSTFLIQFNGLNILTDMLIYYTTYFNADNYQNMIGLLNNYCVIIIYLKFYFECNILNINEKIVIR